MSKLIICLALLFTLPFAALSQHPAPSFSNGIFYSNGNARHTPYRLERDGDTEKDINLETRESSLWKMRWKDNDSYTMEYLSGNDRMLKGTEEFLKKHKLAFRIESATADYYIYTAYLDKVTNQPLKRDTVWLHEMMAFGYTPLFEPVNDLVELRNMHFSDTSSYALLYIYRPGEMTNSGSDFPVYCNDNLLWITRNRAGTVRKIFREGEMRLSSRELKDSATVNVDIHFGHVYYVRAMARGGMHKQGDHQLEMASVPADQGEKEFAEVIR